MIWRKGCQIRLTSNKSSSRSIYYMDKTFKYSKQVLHYRFCFKILSTKCCMYRYAPGLGWCCTLPRYHLTVASGLADTTQFSTRSSFSSIVIESSCVIVTSGASAIRMNFVSPLILRYQ